MPSPSQPSITAPGAPSASSPRRQVRVAIVGSGLTGLVATYLLSAAEPHSPDAPHITVDIFERAPTLGMDSASITVPLSPSTPTAPAEPAASPRAAKRIKRTKLEPEAPAPAPTSMRIDVPMRAFTGGYYPQLLALYRHLGIRAQKTNFTYSFAALLPSLALDGKKRPRAPSPSLLYNGANGVRGISLPSDLMRGLPDPLTVSAVLACVARVRAYVGTLLVLVLGYAQLLLIALWHSRLGHTSDARHPLRTRTLRHLVADAFPARPASRGLRQTAERAVEHVLRRVVRLDVRFVEQTLAPLFSAVMTCSLDAVWASPASEVLDYVALTLGRDHFVVRDGVRAVVAALLVHVTPKPLADEAEPQSKVWTNAQVCEVQHRDGRAWLSVLHHGVEDAQAARMERGVSGSSGSVSTDETCVEDVQEHGPYDHILFATQANQTARFLEAYLATLSSGDAAERRERQRLRAVVDALDTFRYERSCVVNHTDRTLLPAHRGDWRDLNLVSPPSTASAHEDAKQEGGIGSWSNECKEGGCTMATHVLRVPTSAPVVMQTTNPLPGLQPEEATVLSRAHFQRAVLDVASHLARQTLFHRTTCPHAIATAGATRLGLGPLQPKPARAHQANHAHIWVAGSWAHGIPLLEGCVVSASLVAHAILDAEQATLPTSATW